MPRADAKTVLEIGIKSAEVLDKRARDVPVGSVVIQLQREIRVFGQRMRPAAEHVAAARDDVTRARLCDPPVVDVALHRKMVSLRSVPIEAKASLSHGPVVGRLPAGGQRAAVATEVLAIRSKLNIGPDLAAVAHAADTLQL